MKGHTETHEPPRPFGASLVDNLLFLSPRTWWGLLLFQIKSPFAPFDWKSMALLIMRLTLPIMIMAAALPSLNGDSLHPSMILHHQKQVRFLTCYVLSPWTLACAVELLCGLNKFGLRLHNYQARRMSPLPEAVACLQERVECKRAVRYRRFDMYLPAKSTTATPQASPCVILFFPGLLVSHVSYSPVAARLSDEGFIVVILSMEPWRMAFQHLGADQARVAQTQKFIRRNVLQYEHSNNNDNKHPANISWVLMGHSMGTFAAMRLAAELCNSKSWHSSSGEPADQLVMWASASFPGWTTPLPSRVKALVIQGSRDGYYRSTLPHRSRFLNDFSECMSSQHVTIPGANHDNFGSYSAVPSEFDRANISRQKQQTLACRLTARFLKQFKC